jgi:hypothetical protein
VELRDDEGGLFVGDVYESVAGAWGFWRVIMDGNRVAL